MKKNRFSISIKISVRYISLVLFLTCMPILISSCDEDGNLIIPTPTLSEEDVANGLREALKVGTQNSVSVASQTNGYFGNDLIRIPWPQEAAGAYNFISNNMSSVKDLLDEVVLLMNRGAENAADKAGPIFIDAITSITIYDAWDILNGADDAATQYLSDRTFDSLHASFKPDIHNALETVGAATLWSNITTAYNPIANITPGYEPINTDLAEYTTQKALEGLFYLISEEELKIRTDPVARVSDLLKKVFGTLDD